VAVEQGIFRVSEICRKIFFCWKIVVQKLKKIFETPIWENLKAKLKFLAHFSVKNLLLFVEILSKIYKFLSDN